MSLFRKLALTTALGLAACSRPQPPKVTPEGGRVTSISLGGLDVDVRLKVENPNDIDLDVESVVAHVTVDGTYDLGTVVIPKAVHLPANKTIEAVVPVHGAWGNLAALAPLAQKHADIPYEIDGTAKVSNVVTLDLPFKITGTLSRAEMMRIAASAIPKLPGLPF